MAKYAIGDAVLKDKGGTGIVRAIFTTLAGELCYAVEHEGALDFVEDANSGFGVSNPSHPHRMDSIARKEQPCGLGALP
jgi:hypothetical protein